MKISDELKTFPNIQFVFENVYQPSFGWGEIGYRAIHFDYFNFDCKTEFCFDTGHYILSDFNQKDIQNIPFKMTCIHLHSNDGKSDLHVPLTRENFSEWRFIESLLSPDRYIVLEIKNDLKPMNQYIENLKKGIISNGIQLS